MRALSPPCIAIVALTLASGPACEKTTTEHRLEGPLRLATGDCASSSTRYVSGHKPEPFDLQELSKGKVGSPHKRYAAPVRRAGDADAPDASNDGDGGTDGSGSTGTADSEPQLSIGAGTVRGKLDESTVRAAIEGTSARVLDCYRSALAEDSELGGTVSVTFTINRRGKVKDAAADGVSRRVARCVRKAVESLRFPRPSSGKVEVRYPVHVQPGGPGSATGPEISVASEPGPGQDPGQAAERANDPAGDTASDPARDPAAASSGGVAEAARAGAEAARERAHTVMDNPPGYQPGVGNPLRQYRSQLLECFRTKVPTKRPYGSIVVDMVKYQGAHAVVAVASDTGNDTLEQCVQSAIGTASEAIVRAAGSVERCPLAFGSIPLDAAEGIDITEDRVVAGRRVRASVADIAGESPALSELYSWAKKLAKRRTRQRQKIAASDQPIVIRPLGTTPVGVVRRVLETTTAAGLDAVLAVSRGGTWQPVNGFSLPGVPVPRGSGQGFHLDRHAGKHRDSGAPTIHASLLVGADDVWLGISRIDDFRRFTTRGQKLDLDVFQRGLRDVKNMQYFTDRRDLEIAAMDEVAYDTLVTFIDYATAAGFTEWTLMAPDELSARPAEAR